MLCSSKTNNRPDKTLQKALLRLAAALVLLTLSLIWFFLYPEDHLYSTISTSVITVYCLLTAIKTLNAGEAAISYGGFANEIIRNDFKLRRIENPAGESIIQNEPAKDLLKDFPVLNFLERHLAAGDANQAALFRLETARKNLGSDKVTLSLTLKQNDDRVFNELEYFEISLRPIYLKKPQIFDGAFSVKRIRPNKTWITSSKRNVRHFMTFWTIFRSAFMPLTKTTAWNTSTKTWQSFSACSRISSSGGCCKTFCRKTPPCRRIANHGSARYILLTATAKTPRLMFFKMPIVKKTALSAGASWFINCRHLTNCKNK